MNVKFKCPGQHLGISFTSEQGSVLCEVILEVSGYMFPGSGLQTETESSDFGFKNLAGNFFFMRQTDK